MRICAGSAFPGASRCGGRASICRLPRRAVARKKLEAAGLLYPSFESRSEIAAMVAERERAGPWPRDPIGALYPGMAGMMPPEERACRRRVGQPFALRLETAAAAARTGPLSWSESGSGPQRQTGRVTAEPQRCTSRRRGVTSSLKARKETCRPATTTSLWRSTTPCKGVTDVARAGLVLGDWHSSAAAGAA